MPKINQISGLDLYISFLNVALTHAKEAPISELDPNEIAMLESIALKDYAGENLTVMGLMALEGLGSPATLHRRLSRLRRLGVIDVLGDKHDSRIKYLKVTPVVHDYLARMGKALLKLNAR
jgi:DNA-binding MarR family transcriptional regulator